MELIGTKEAGKILGIDGSTVANWIKKGHLDGFIKPVQGKKVKRRFSVDRGAVKAFMETDEGKKMLAFAHERGAITRAALEKRRAAAVEPPETRQPDPNPGLPPFGTDQIVEISEQGSARADAELATVRAFEIAEINVKMFGRCKDDLGRMACIGFAAIVEALRGDK